LYSAEGTRVYIARCQQCHDQNRDAHAPLPEALATRPWEDILKALETGVMRAQGAQLTPEERRAVARYLGKAGTSGVVFSPSVDGHIRAFRMSTGEVVWDFDAVRDYTTVNGVLGRGGSFSSTGAVVVDGMLYVNSGYSSMAGNVLLAFSVK
jgi:polyvinyl alcohol dehydrogenase (cytochrome)